MYSDQIKQAQEKYISALVEIYEQLESDYETSLMELDSQTQVNTQAVDAAARMINFYANFAQQAEQNTQQINTVHSHINQLLENPEQQIPHAITNGQILTGDSIVVYDFDRCSGALDNYNSAVDDPRYRAGFKAIHDAISSYADDTKIVPSYDCTNKRVRTDNTFHESGYRSQLFTQSHINRLQKIITNANRFYKDKQIVIACRVLSRIFRNGTNSNFETARMGAMAIRDLLKEHNIYIVAIDGEQNNKIPDHTALYFDKITALKGMKPRLFTPDELFMLDYWNENKYAESKKTGTQDIQTGTQKGTQDIQTGTQKGTQDIQTGTQKGTQTACPNIAQSQAGQGLARSDQNGEHYTLYKN